MLPPRLGAMRVPLILRDHRPPDPVAGARDTAIVDGDGGRRVRGGVGADG